jgi:outer membrane murein-binding lipoprotein Lpp
MVRRWFGFVFLAVFIVTLSGCASARKKNDLEMQKLNNQVQVLQSQLDSKDQEISSLKEELSKACQDKSVSAEKSGKKRSIPEVKSRPSAKHIQIALRNAGYYTGSIDGSIGRQTREATKEFQKANNLPADGKVGKKTWNLLRGYLYKKVK